MSVSTALPPSTLQTLSAITLFVEDLPKCKEFYTTVFRVPILFEDPQSCAFKFQNLIVNLLDAPEASSLLDCITHEIGGPEAGKRFQISIWVDDLELVYESLVLLGVKGLYGPVLQPWGMKTVTFTDPAGHCWELGQRVPAGSIPAPEAAASE
jgi:catechol 2,3-dioxygenase-like lactoylglutathione lyase family enzyme